MEKETLKSALSGNQNMDYQEIKELRNKVRAAISDAHYVSGLNNLSDSQRASALNAETVLRELSEPVFTAFDKAYNKKFN